MPRFVHTGKILLNCVSPEREELLNFKLTNLHDEKENMI